jgi:predicted DNA-binding transcriptional regulator AlpA
MDIKILPPSNRSASLYALSDLLRKGSFSKSHLYNLIARNFFPKPTIVLGPRFTRWSAEECDQWFANPSRWIELQKKNESAGA